MRRVEAADPAAQRDSGQTMSQDEQTLALGLVSSS
jgi:hypothetical protein